MVWNQNSTEIEAKHNIGGESETAAEASSNPSLLPERKHVGFMFGTYTGLPFSSPNPNNIGATLVSKFLNSNSKHNCWDGMIMEENGERAQLVKALDGEKTNPIEVEEKLWIVQRVRKLNDSEYMVKWWGSDRENVEHRSHLQQTIFQADMADLAAKAKRVVKEHNKLHPPTPMEQALTQLVHQRHQERQAQLEQIRSCFQKKIVDRNSIGVKGAITFSDMYVGSDAMSRPHVQYFEGFCYPDVLATLYSPTLLEWVEKTWQRDVPDNVIERKRTYTCLSTRAFADWHGVELTVCKSTKRGGETQSSIVAGIATIFSGFSILENAWKILLKNKMTPLAVDLAVKWGDGTCDDDKANVLREGMQDMRRPVAMVIDDKIVASTKFLRVVIPVREDDELGAYHNVFGVVLYGRCGWIPLIKVTFTGMPQLTFEEKYTRTNLISLIGKVTLKWRIWYICNLSHTFRYE